MALHLTRIDHGGTLQVFCEEGCEAGFTYAAELTKHYLTRTPSEQYSCSQCSKVFLDKSHLRVHSAMHTGEKRFKCDFCEKAFLYQRNWYIHRRVHTGEKPWVCWICGVAWAHSLSYKDHIARKHKTEDPKYACPIQSCQKNFLGQFGVDTHLKSHDTPGEQFVCTHCLEDFEDEEDYYRHLG